MKSRVSHFQMRRKKLRFFDFKKEKGGGTNEIIMQNSYKFCNNRDLGRGANKTHECVSTCMGKKAGIKAQVEAFEQFRPDIKVNIQEEPWSAEKILTLAAADNLPDGIVNCGDYLGLFWSRGLLEPLDSYIETWEDRNRVPERFWDAVTFVDRKIYGMPEYYSPRVFCYNKDHFAAAGLKEPPDTYPEMLEYAKKLTQDTNGDGRVDQWGIVAPLVSWEADKIAIYMLSYDKSAKIIATRNGRFTKYHVMPPDEPSLDEEMARATFAGGKASMYPLGYSYDIPFFKRSVNLGVGPVLSGPKPKGRHYAWFTPYEQILFKTSKHKQAVWEFMKFAAIGVGADLNASKAGFLPFDKALGPKYAEDPDMTVLIEEMQAGYMYPESFDPAWGVAKKFFEDNNSKALVGQITPEEAFKIIVKSFQEELDRVYAQL